MQVAAFQQQLAQADGGVIGIGKEGILDDHTRPAARFQDLDEMLQKQKSGLAGLDGEVLLHLGAFLAAKGRIGQDDIVAVFLLNIGQVLRQRVGMQDVRRFDAVQDHVHDADDVGQRFLFFAVEGLLLQRFHICGGQALAGSSGIQRPRTRKPAEPTAPS